ncbi:MAG: antitoxin VapB family protein [Candidatus Caldarchaeum sp.]|uniref:Antitoxin n=1 Tax=Caldiarchaeum subterraneum TaxID=311458 RepID=A0A7C4I745_CALS0
MKTITIRDDVYVALVKRKRDGESFSDVIERLLKRSRVDIG